MRFFTNLILIWTMFFTNIVLADTPRTTDPGIIDTKGVSTPGNPASGRFKLYPKTDGKWYTKNNAGAESLVGDGSSLDSYYAEGFEVGVTSSSLGTGNSATLTGGSIAGTLTDEAGAAVINGTRSIKFTQTGGSLNDYFCSPNISLAGDKLKGNYVGLKYFSKYDGASNDIRALLYDVTNSSVLGSGIDYIEASSTSRPNASAFFIPASTSTIKWCFQVTALNSGKILYLDDVEITTDPFKYITSPESQFITNPLLAALIDGTGGIRFTIGSLTNRGPTIISAADDTVNARTNFTAVRNGRVDLTFRGIILSNSTTFSVYKNGTIIAVGNQVSSSQLSTDVSANFEVQSGDVFYIETNLAIQTANGATLTINAQSNSTNIATPINSFYSLTAPLAFKATAIASTDPVGTFNTYSYAGSTNTRTICATAPTQAISDMLQNGFRIFTRVYASASTCGNPVRLELKIGKGMRGLFTSFYKSTGLTTIGNTDFTVRDATEEIGFNVYNYNEITGVITFDSGYNINTGTTVKRFQFSDITTQADGYLVISAGGTPQLSAVPIPQICFLKDVKTSGSQGGTFTSGAFQTRTLNTTSGSCNFVTLSSNQFTLGPGEYTVEGSAMAQQVDEHKAKIRNTTDSSDTILGSSVFAGAGAGNSNSVFADRVILTSQKTFELQHRCTTTKATNGFGTAGSFGVDEVYAQVKITKWR